MARSFKMSFLSLGTYSYKVKIQFDLCTIEWLSCSHRLNQFVTKVSFYWSQSSLSLLRVLVILGKLLCRTKSIEILYWKYNNAKSESIVPDWPAGLWFLSRSVVSWKHSPLLNKTPHTYMSTKRLQSNLVYLRDWKCQD